MKFVAIDVPPGHDPIYRSEEFDLTHSVVGFGISSVSVKWRSNGAHAGIFAGHDALAKAMRWCEANGDPASAKHACATHREGVV